MRFRFMHMKVLGRSASLCIPVLLVIAACHASTHIPRPATADEYRPYLLSGSASISGEAFLLASDSSRVNAAGQEVVIDPLTPFVKEWLRRAVEQPFAYNTGPSDSLFARARRTTVADADGRFMFADLPAGTYLVRTEVRWQTRSRFGRYNLAHGGVVGDTVTLAVGEARHVILNKAPR